jgi:hypothetical protein
MNFLETHSLWIAVRAALLACRLPILKHGNLLNPEIIISRKIL